MNELLIAEYEAGQRLDKFLRKYFNDAPSGFIYKMLRKKRIKLNGCRAEGGEILTSGDIIKFYISPVTMDKFMSVREIIPGCNSAGSIDIIYEDDNILVVNKPRGILTHGAKGAGQPKEDTLIERCLVYLYAKGEFLADKESVFTPAFCNRLDRNTSGVVICGKNPAAMRGLNRSIADRHIEKYYLAVVIGEHPGERELRSFHRKNALANRATIAADGKEMITGIMPLATNQQYSLLSIRLVTGRQHQIRAQLSAIGCPIVGDYKYGGKTAGVKWQLLHADKVVLAGLPGGLKHLNGMKFYAPPDKWFTDNVQKFIGRYDILLDGVYALTREVD